ncbi:MAG: hypothetical protein ACLQGP_32675, partial [Isosphaeraceae bacterium]
ATGAVLDTETVSSFSSGVYLKWSVSGNILITIKALAGPNAELDGLFFDPNSSLGALSIASASFSRQSLATSGSGIGVSGDSADIETGTLEFYTGRDGRTILRGYSSPDVADAATPTLKKRRVASIIPDDSAQ